MKKKVCVLFGFLFFTFSLSGCSDDFVDPSVYVVPAENCIVSVPNDFGLEVPELCETVCEKVATAIKDIKRTDGREYYSVTKDSPINIVRDKNWFEYDRKDRAGSGKIISGFQIGTQTMKFVLHDGDVTFSCRENCDIEPIYETFTTVGELFLEKSDGDFDLEYLYNARNFFSDDGKIMPQSGLFYLYLIDDFGDMPACWNTNLTVKSFSCTARDGEVKSATFTVEKLSDELAACMLCRYDVGGNYFIGFVSLSGVSGESGVLVGTTTDIGENELTVNFYDPLFPQTEPPAAPLSSQTKSLATLSYRTA